MGDRPIMFTLTVGVSILVIIGSIVYFILREELNDMLIKSLSIGVDDLGKDCISDSDCLASKTDNKLICYSDLGDQNKKCKRAPGSLCIKDDECSHSNFKCQASLGKNICKLEGDLGKLHQVRSPEGCEDGLVVSTDDICRYESGTKCESDNQCSTGMCLSGICSLSGVGGDCPLGLRLPDPCTEGYHCSSKDFTDKNKLKTLGKCQANGVENGDPGALCSVDSECRDGVCSKVPGAPFSVCTRRGFGTIGVQCSSNDECVSSLDCVGNACTFINRIDKCDNDNKCYLGRCDNENRCILDSGYPCRYIDSNLDSELCLTGLCNQHSTLSLFSKAGTTASWNTDWDDILWRVPLFKKSVGTTVNTDITILARLTDVMSGFTDTNTYNGPSRHQDNLIIIPSIASLETRSFEDTIDKKFLLSEDFVVAIYVYNEEMWKDTLVILGRIRGTLISHSVELLDTESPDTIVKRVHKDRYRIWCTYSLKKGDTYRLRVTGLVRRSGDMKGIKGINYGMDFRVDRKKKFGITVSAETSIYNSMGDFRFFGSQDAGRFGFAENMESNYFHSVSRHNHLNTFYIVVTSNSDDISIVCSSNYDPTNFVKSIKTQLIIERGLTMFMYPNTSIPPVIKMMILNDDRRDYAAFLHNSSDNSSLVSSLMTIHRSDNDAVFTFKEFKTLEHKNIKHIEEFHPHYSGGKLALGQDSSTDSGFLLMATIEYPSSVTVKGLNMVRIPDTEKDINTVYPLPGNFETSDIVNAGMGEVPFVVSKYLCQKSKL